MLEYLLMLRTNFGKYDELADSVIDIIKSYKYELKNANSDCFYGFDNGSSTPGIRDALRPSLWAFRGLRPEIRAKTILRTSDNVPDR